MNRDISVIDEAIKSIRIWFSNTRLMHQGNKLFTSHANQDLKQPKFAKWYYGEGQIYKDVESYKIIEKYYKSSFDAYLAYNKLYKSPVKKGFFSSKTKHNNELNGLIYDFQEKIKILIKSVEFFKKRLVELPLNQEISVSTPAIAKTTINTNKKDNKNTLVEIDYEKKLYQEVAKVKKQLEQEYQLRIEAEKTTLNSKITLTSEKGKSIQKDIDIDEEMRRILS